MSMLENEFMKKVEKPVASDAELAHSVSPEHRNGQEVPKPYGFLSRSREQKSHEESISA